MLDRLLHSLCMWSVLCTIDHMGGLISACGQLTLANYHNRDTYNAHVHAARNRPCARRKAEYDNLGGVTRFARARMMPS